VKKGKTYKRVFGGFRLTTNNRMVIGCNCRSEKLKNPIQSTCCSDSKYVVDSVLKNGFGWEKKKFVDRKI
jgi:ribonuclease HI